MEKITKKLSLNELNFTALDKKQMTMVLGGEQQQQQQQQQQMQQQQQ
jgi:hypothetical protein